MSVQIRRQALVALCSMALCVCGSWSARAEDPKPMGDEPAAVEVDNEGVLRIELGDFPADFGVRIERKFEEVIRESAALQELQAKLSAKMDDLVFMARGLNDAEHLMQAAAEVAKLAEEVDALQKEVAKKQEALAKKMGAVDGPFGGIGFGVGHGGVGAPPELDELPPEVPTEDVAPPSDE